MHPEGKAKLGISLGLICIAFGCVFLLLVAEMVETREDEFQIALEARANLERELHHEREAYQQNMNGALEELHRLRNEINGSADADGAGEPAE